MRVRLKIAYVGSRYVGWQRQPNGVSVQETIENVLRRIYSQSVCVVGAGRTDAGVHAAEQIAHFDQPKERPAVKELPGILNKLLPGDITVLEAARTPQTFHARKSAVARTYRYRILTRDIPDPFRAPLVWHAQWASNAGIGRMRREAKKWMGTRNFEIFTIRRSPGENTRRTMKKIEIRKVGDEIHFTFVADAFLHRMVRRMVAFLLDVGLGQKRKQPAYAAPAQGLCLMHVAYNPLSSGRSGGGVFRKSPKIL